MPWYMTTSDDDQAPSDSPNTSTLGRRCGGMPRSRCRTPSSSSRNWLRPSATFWIDRNEGNRPYWMQAVAMSPRLSSSADSIMVWSTHPVPVGETSSSQRRSYAPVRSSSSSASSARPVGYSGCESYPTKTRIGWLTAGSCMTSVITSGVTTSVTYRRPCRPRSVNGATLAGPPDTNGFVGTSPYPGSTVSLARPTYPTPALYAADSPTAQIPAFNVRASSCLATPAPRYSIHRARVAR